VYRLTLTLRGLWWRRGLTAAVLAVATITTASAALGPLYARAAAESTLHDQLATASVTTTGLHYSETTDVASSAGLQSVLDDGPAAGKIPGYPTRISGIYTAASATGPAGLVNTGVLWRQGICAHLVITSGVCPARPGQALVSARTLTGGVYGWRLGVRLTLGGLSIGGLDANGFPGA
jgi:putative ABC transport system permease protein